MRPLYKTRSLAACLLCIAAATAQQNQGTAAVTAVPRLVRFAGSFHPPVNQPAGPVGATFAISNQQEGGTPLWTEDQNVELDANGNYTALLGSARNEGVPVELFTAAEARWLQVKFYVPAEVDLPRVLLVSVPYALKAGDADTLGGKPASAYQLAGSGLSVQPVESAKPTAAVSVETVPAVAPSFTSGGSPNYIAKFTDTTGDVEKHSAHRIRHRIGKLLHLPWANGPLGAMAGEGHRRIYSRPDALHRRQLEPEEPAPHRPADSKGRDGQRGHRNHNPSSTPGGQWQRSGGRQSHAQREHLVANQRHSSNPGSHQWVWQLQRGLGSVATDYDREQRHGCWGRIPAKQH
jgi:hypothetical protein